MRPSTAPPPTDRRPTALVVGATGAQGGGVARHLLARGRFAVRALTREPAGTNACLLRAAGAEVVGGDLADPASLRDALAGADAVFGVTSWWEHEDGEYALGRNLLEAVAASRVRHLVLSTQPAAAVASGGRLSVPPLDIKARLEADARALRLPATFVHVAFYYESFFYLVPPTRQADGRLGLELPIADAPLAAVGAEDVGGVVARLFEAPDTWLGMTLPVAGDERPVGAYLAALAPALGAPVDYGFMSREAFADLRLPWAATLADLFEYYRRFVPRRTAAIDRCRALYPGLRGFDAWADGRGRQLARNAA